MRSLVFAWGVVVVLSLSTSAGAAEKSLYRARCNPYRSMDGTGGYVCTNIIHNSRFAKAGLENGDIVLAVDDVTLDGPKTAVTMLNDIEKGASKEILIRRNGQEMTLTPRFK